MTDTTTRVALLVAELLRLGAELALMQTKDEAAQAVVRRRITSRVKEITRALTIKEQAPT